MCCLIYDTGGIYYLSCFSIVTRHLVVIIRYAYELRDDQLIILSMEGLRDCVRMRLRDYGKKTPIQEMKGRAHDAIRPGGLGLHLMRDAFDRVDYIAKPRGTEVVLTKKLEAGNAT